MCYASFQLLARAVDVLTPSGIEKRGSQVGLIKVSDPKKTRKVFRFGAHDTFGENKGAIVSVKFKNGTVTVYFIKRRHF